MHSIWSYEGYCSMQGKQRDWTWKCQEPKMSQNVIKRKEWSGQEVTTLVTSVLVPAYLSTELFFIYKSIPVWILYYCSLNDIKRYQAIELFINGANSPRWKSYMGLVRWFITSNWLVKISLSVTYESAHSFFCIFFWGETHRG